jgi:hypothetical protein
MATPHRIPFSPGHAFGLPGTIAYSIARAHAPVKSESGIRLTLRAIPAAAKPHATG